MSHETPPSTLDPSALFKQVFEMRLSFLAVLNPQGVVLEINKAPLRLGFNRGDYVGRHIGETPSFAADPDDGFLSFVHPDDRTMWQRTMMRAFDPATPEWSLEYRLQSASDEPTWIGARGQVTFNEAGKPRSITGVVFALPGRRTAAGATGRPADEGEPPVSLSWPSRLDPRD